MYDEETKAAYPNPEQEHAAGRREMDETTRAVDRLEKIIAELDERTVFVRNPSGMLKAEKLNEPQPVTAPLTDHARNLRLRIDGVVVNLRGIIDSLEV